MGRGRPNAGLPAPVTGQERCFAAQPGRVDAPPLQLHKGGKPK